LLLEDNIFEEFKQSVPYEECLQILTDIDHQCD